MRHLKIKNFTILVFFLVFVIEGGSFLCGLFIKNKGYFYKHVVADFKEYQKWYLPILGWGCQPDSNNKDFDTICSRITPAFPDPKLSPPLVSAYGNSLTWGHGVRNENTWSNVLAKLLNRGVNNFGVNAYGTDQAYLRFLGNDLDQAKIVLLCHLSENIIRNLNQFRDLIYRTNGTGFKPRFIINQQGALEFVPLPEFNITQYNECIQRPERYLVHDYFSPGSLGGVSHLTFPYTLSILRTFNHFLIRSKFHGLPWYAEFYQEDHGAHGVQITAGIMQLFIKECLLRNKVPVIVLLPTGIDLEYYRTHKVWIYQTLINRLKELGIEPLDIGPFLIKRLGERNVRKILINNIISEHPNKEGCEIIAEIVYEYLVKEEKLPQS
jgi:hypothetical protein